MNKCNAVRSFITCFIPLNHFVRFEVCGLQNAIPGAWSSALYNIVDISKSFDFVIIFCLKWYFAVTVKP